MSASTETVEGFKQVGQGLTVFEDDQVVEGPIVWLDSPQDVIDFVNSGDVENSIVLARGGTTTFLTPALTGGVKGVLTLQGAPTSHLGIVSREFGIPCIMSVAFSEGVRSGRGEVIPADGVRVRLDVSTTPGTVYVEEGAPTSDELPEGGVQAPAGPSEEELAQVQVLLERFRGETPHDSAGDEEFRSKYISTDVLTTSKASLAPDALDRERLDEFQAYMGWNLWDCLAARATEGESGLIPRQEYEAFGCVQGWQRYPEFIRYITEQVGADGLHDIGGIVRREIGNKANFLHAWCVGLCAGFGRGIKLGLGAGSPGEREEDLAVCMQFMRRLMAGAWGDDGGIFASQRGYRQPFLGDAWLERFREESVSTGDPETRARFQKFSATTEMMGFLMHFDNRVGLSDTGPYPTGDGGFVIVRDHFLSDDLYHWGDVAEGLPHVVTQAMFFQPTEPIELQLVDIGTLYTKPGNYLKHLTGMAVYARDCWDTPISDVRRIDDAEMDAITTKCQGATTTLYRRIASMSRRDKIMAGGQVYYTDFIAPIARAAGCWEALKNDFDFFEIDPEASELYYKIVDGAAQTLVPQLFLTGTGFVPFEAAVDGAAAMPALHLLALRGMASELPDVGIDLEEAGLVTRTKAGFMLTEQGHALHDRQLLEERRSFDEDKVRGAYDRFLAVNGPLKALSSKWQTASEYERFGLLGELTDIVERVEPALKRTSDALPRFAPYAGRLRAALEAADDGDLDYVVSPKVDSVHTVWMEVHEDYLQTLGISREAEGSY